MNDPILYHRQTWDLIPWMLNGTASAAERQLVEEHLRACANCREEFAFQRQVYAGMALDPVTAESNAHLGFKRLLARIDEEGRDNAEFTADTAINEAPYASDPRREWPASSGLGWGRYRSRLLAAVLVAQTVGLVLLGIFVIGHEHSTSASATYETLSRTSSIGSPATIRFVPAPSLTVGAMQTMLVDVKLRIVESSQGSSIYGLAPDVVSESGAAADTAAERAARTAAAVTRLRSQRGVLLAEPIVSPPPSYR